MPQEARVVWQWDLEGIAVQALQQLQTLTRDGGAVLGIRLVSFIYTVGIQ